MSVQGDTPDQPDQRRPERMPVRVKWLIGLLWFQTAVNALGTVMVFIEAQDLADHNEEGAGSLVGAGVVSLVVVVLLAVSAIAAMHRRSWGWVLTLVIEIITAVGGLAVIGEGNGAGVGGTAIAVGLISLLCAPQTRQWYGRRSARRSDVVD